MKLKKRSVIPEIPIIILVPNSITKDIKRLKYEDLFQRAKKILLHQAFRRVICLMHWVEIC